MNCKITETNKVLVTELTREILKKAATIENAERSKDPDYSETGPGRPDGND